MNRSFFFFNIQYVVRIFIYFAIFVKDEDREAAPEKNRAYMEV